MLLLVYLFVKQGLFIRNDYKLSEKQIDEISKSYFINILDGNWQGRATQIEVKDSFDIELECNRISMQFKIIYPTLKCFLLF